MQSSQLSNLTSFFRKKTRSSLSCDGHSLEERLQVDYLLNPNELDQAELEAAQEVITGLSNPSKYLPPRYFYDDRGSQLFEQICNLPEYYLTRTEAAILQNWAGAIAQITGPCEIVELGSGSSTKMLTNLKGTLYATCPLISVQEFWSIVPRSCW
jgi:L-histidine Nalpha-methyltransferase